MKTFNLLPFLLTSLLQVCSCAANQNTLHGEEKPVHQLHHQLREAQLPAQGLNVSSGVESLRREKKNELGTDGRMLRGFSSGAGRGGHAKGEGSLHKQLLRQRHSHSSSSTLRQPPSSSSSLTRVIVYALSFFSLLLCR
ncbi:hypothetical protein Cni_G27848 [Canna indica]|uniref:Uncharacterized protein n=1 Tax=Canna indica TaxID=4628 RepID=A0AAQ3QRT8_9LILI|nr:hypothetical protein Cni_G27848 [Canna indica]